MVNIRGPERNLAPWARSGKPDEILGKGYGKFLLRRMFNNPDTRQEEDFVLFGQKDWSVVLAVTTELEVLLVDQFKQGCESIVTELPAGTADFVEKSPLDVMRSELLAETGYGAGEVIAFQPKWIATRNSPTRFHPFLAVGCERRREARYDLAEMIQWYSIPLVEWLRMVLLDQIAEPSAIVATMLAIPHLVSRGILPRDLYANVLEEAARATIE